MTLHCLSGQRKPLVELLISALKILLVPMRLIKPASHRLRGEGLTNLIGTSINHLSRNKLVSGIWNTGFQFSGIMVSSGKNIHDYGIYSDKAAMSVGQGYHYGIQVGDVVYDNMTPGGLQLSSWLEDLGLTQGIESISWKYVDIITNK